MCCHMQECCLCHAKAAAVEGEVHEKAKTVQQILHEVEEKKVRSDDLHCLPMPRQINIHVHHDTYPTQSPSMSEVTLLQ